MLFEDFCGVVCPLTLSYCLKTCPLGSEVKASYPGEQGKVGKPPPPQFLRSYILILTFVPPWRLCVHIVELDEKFLRDSPRCSFPELLKGSGGLCGEEARFVCDGDHLIETSPVIFFESRYN